MLLNEEIFFLLLLLYPICAFSEVIVFGGEDFSGNSNYFTTDHPFSKVILDSTTHPLIRSKAGHSDISMLIADKINLSSESWELKIKEDLKFSNKNPIAVMDVIWSLSRCKNSGLFQNTSEFKPQDSSVVLKFKQKPDYEKTMSEISVCPVLEQKSSEIFAYDFGVGTNLVSSGNYFISNFKEGKSINLRLSKQSQNVRRPDEVELRLFQNAEEGLTALRTGALVIFFSEDLSVLEKAESDQTLKTGQCEEFRYASRKDFLYNCNDSFDISMLNIEH